MGDLVILKNNDAFTTSLIIAEGTHVKHRSVQKTIDAHIKRLEKFGRVRFEITPQQTKGGVQNKKIYYLTEEQATLLITFLKNTDIVADFKVELVRQFYAMRKILLEKQTQTWMETRYQGKLTRKSETEVLQQLVEYAQTQGSKNSDRLYMVYSKLANQMAGVTSRDQASVMQLNNLNVIENIILHCIQLGILEDKQYKQIYQDCKQRLISYQEIAFLEPAKEIKHKSA
jgi:phage regulator Rha-like protein